MSIEDPDFFARWSRRKQAARSPRALSAEEVPPVAGRPVTEVAEVPPDPPSSAVATDTTVLHAPLPSVDDLTPASDLTAYLREGVPELLKKAALRKMWSLDPTIRDHIGLAENAWDFNQPDSIPGFGAIGTTASVPEFLSRRVAAITDPGASGATLRAPVRPALPDRRTETGVLDMPPSQEPVGPSAAPEAATSATFSEAEPPSEAGAAGSPEPVRSMPIRRHGGALPRE